MLAPCKGARRIQRNDATGEFEALGSKAPRKEVAISYSVPKSLIGLNQHQQRYLAFWEFLLTCFLHGQCHEMYKVRQTDCTDDSARRSNGAKVPPLRFCGPDENRAGKMGRLRPC
jgi:hypothetical protein